MDLRRIRGVLYMREWMDLNDDGEIDAFEQMMKDEMLYAMHQS